MDLAALQARLQQGNIGTIVATLGTTATGSVDPLAEILELREKFKFRIHADAAYGGYFVLASNLGSEATRAFEHIGGADSIVIDPHKHGLQPYGCGCVLFRDPDVGRLYKHESPYTYFSSNQLHLGEISLECSRPGAAAVALWATQQLLPLEKHGEFAQGLEASRAAALDLYHRLKSDPRFATACEPELDIVVFAPRAGSVGESSALARKIFSAAASRNLHLALATLPVEFFAANLGSMKKDQPAFTCLRSVLMKLEHQEWLPKIWQALNDATNEALKS
jgi:glutamate/tyrosine decarboxylase-like PLP-dependent enzyme